VTNLWTTYESPLGPLTLIGGPDGLSALDFPGRGAALDETLRRPEAFTAVVDQLEQYFVGTRTEFNLPLDLHGTPFQRRVWARLAAIPYGETISYGRLAEAIGRPDRVRAAAAAVGRTPVPIIVPCHRVIAANGDLTGYGGGLHRKQALLALEAATRRREPPPAVWAYRQLSLV
jgi:methylated-DNA-[protein]-cysteine S-methyltransferase